MKLVICVGISGSGKSTWVEEFLKFNPEYLRISRDDLRIALVKNMEGYYQRKDLNNIEHGVNWTIEMIIYYAKTINYNLIVDNTNLTFKYIDAILKQAKSKTYQFKLFDIDVETAKRRVIKRDFGGSYTVQNREKLVYIDKQFEQYKQIKQLILTDYKDNIIC